MLLQNAEVVRGQVSGGNFVPSLADSPACRGHSGEILRGTWFDRSAEFLARQRGETVFPSQFATTFDVELTPLPCLQHLTADRF